MRLTTLWVTLYGDANVSGRGGSYSHVQKKAIRALAPRSAMGGKLTTKKSSPEVRPYDYLYKLVLVGDSDTGKTSLMTGFGGGDFSTDHIPTVGVDFTIRTIGFDEMLIKLQMWDTAGDPRFRIVKQAYRAAHGVIIVYDATKEKTFDNVPCWLEEVKNASPEATVMLVGGKCDLTKEKVVDYRTAKDFADERGIMLMKVSAKEGTNVELAFLTLVAKIRQADFTSMSSEIGVK